MRRLLVSDVAFYEAGDFSTGNEKAAAEGLPL
jgi:hypothetical protein